jgi:hypothetical protein
MQIPSEYLNYAIGALAALAFTKWQGWLKLPFLDGFHLPPVAPVTLVHPPQPFPDATREQSYSATIAIPHKITVTPQKGSD